MEQQDFFENKTGLNDDLSYIDEIKESFIDYAMSVITSRALPDIRDGLKPVQRRILYAMAKEGLYSDKKFSKCAGIVGEVLKRYHPHGDTAVYDALVRMSQSWIMRYALVEGQGNFGSIDGDSPAAYRYTEARLDKLSDYLMHDIEKDTVDMTDNYNNTDKEPIVLPARFPNLLINGASGIAVGMATNIPPHNMSEVLEALIEMVKNPSMKDEKLLEYIKGPDFPTSAFIINDNGIKDAYLNGKGTIRLRACIELEKHKDKKRIVIKEIPYGVVKTRITTRIVELIKTKKLDGITDIRDESTKDGVRIVLDLSKTAPAEFIIEKLYKNTALDSNFAVNMVALIDGKPKLVKLKDVLALFIDYREEVIRRRTLFELKKAEEKKHILEGFTKVLNKKERYLKEILPKSKDKADLKVTVESEFKLSPIQSEALVILPNYRFSGLEAGKIIEEYNELAKEVEELLSILSSEQKIKKIMIKEFTEIRAKFSEPRKTKIISDFEDKKLTDLIPSQEVVVSVTDGGFIKRYFTGSERSTERTSKIVFTGDDVVRYAIKANMAGKVTIFSASAKAYPLRVFEIPEMRRYGKGMDLKELLKQKVELKVVGLFDESDDSEVVLVTKAGYVKRIKLSELSALKANGIQLFSLRKGDELIGVEKIYFERQFLTILDEKFKTQNINLMELELSERGKAATKVADGIKDYLLSGNDKPKPCFVYADGSVSDQVLKLKPAGLIDTDSNHEFVAQTNTGRYIAMSTITIPELNSGESIVRIFSYDDPEY
jgi:DNA gyrase subunit A